MSQIVSAVPFDIAQQKEDVVSVGNEQPGCHGLQENGFIAKIRWTAKVAW
jgi:hypothetical protein